MMQGSLFVNMITIAISIINLLQKLAHHPRFTVHLCAMQAPANLIGGHKVEYIHFSIKHSEGISWHNTQK